VHHPDRQAEVLGVVRALEVAVPDPDVLAADPLQPEVGVVDAEVAGAGQGGIGESAERESQERGVDLVLGAGA
jgi:hypothetical protein